MPLKPIAMYPAYRFGTSTPWGGKGLKEMYKKPIPDDRTGEALEVSCIPGLCSRDETGRELPELIARYGAALTGSEVHSPFPLLLKLLDARDTLSVQVHPDDDYAARVEGKLGKTEAWVILRAQEGAELVYGVIPGCTKEALHDASVAGSEVEKYLRRVKVKAGETYYIPSGMVHAIGQGIMLYEIQQSSDVTYRFYDWERTDKQGNKRQLHLEKALDVTDLSLCPDAVIPCVLSDDETGLHERILDEKYFGLDRYTRCNGMMIHPDRRRFAILTALADGEMTVGGENIAIPAGQTYLMPADGEDVYLKGDMYLLAYPTV